MTPIIEISTFDADINLMDLTDPVLGGLSGETNNPLIALANRTRYLFDRPYQIEAVTSGTSIDNSFVRKLVNINASGNISLLLDDVANFPLGAGVAFTSKCADKKAITLTPFGSQSFKKGRVSKTLMWLCDAETLVLIANTDHWIVLHAEGNHYNAGEDDFVRKQPQNTLIANGCTPEIGGSSLYLRADLPRLWDAVKDDAVDDSQWLSDNFTYRGFFSKGNGTTTFRVPDLRAMSIRGLDLGRGVSLGRINPSVAGGYEPDNIKLLQIPIYTGGGGTNAGIDRNLTGGGPYNVPDTGGTETTVKNIGKIPVVYY